MEPEWVKEKQAVLSSLEEKSPRIALQNSNIIIDLKALHLYVVETVTSDLWAKSHEAQQTFTKFYDN